MRVRVVMTGLNCHKLVCVTPRHGVGHQSDAEEYFIRGM